ncbi:MAG: TatD family hydrolase [Dehalococcoidia bacterium]
MLRIIDTHAHLDELEKLEPALDKAKGAGVIAFVAVGSNHQSNQKVMEISLSYPSFVYPAFGLHPWELGNLESHQFDAALRFIEERAAEIVAIGEIGLDYDKRVVKAASKELQQEALKRLLALAKAHEKPAIIHSRYAWKDSFELVKGSGIKKPFFTGSPDFPACSRTYSMPAISFQPLQPRNTIKNTDGLSRKHLWKSYF